MIYLNKKDNMIVHAKKCLHQLNIPIQKNTKILGSFIKINAELIIIPKTKNKNSVQSLKLKEDLWNKT